MRVWIYIHYTFPPTYLQYFLQSVSYVVRFGWVVTFSYATYTTSRNIVTEIYFCVLPVECFEVLTYFTVRYVVRMIWPLNHVVVLCLYFDFLEFVSCHASVVIGYYCDVWNYFTVEPSSVTENCCKVSPYAYQLRIQLWIHRMNSNYISNLTMLFIVTSI